MTEADEAIRRVESGVYGGLDLAFLLTEADEALRRVESGVYGGLNLALFVDRGGGAIRRVESGVFGELNLAFFAAGRGEANRLTADPPDRPVALKQLPQENLSVTGDGKDVVALVEQEDEHAAVLIAGPDVDFAVALFAAPLLLGVEELFGPAFASGVGEDAAYPAVKAIGSFLVSDFVRHRALAVVGYEGEVFSIVQSSPDFLNTVV